MHTSISLLSTFFLLSSLTVTNPVPANAPASPNSNNGLSLNLPKPLTSPAFANISSSNSNKTDEYGINCMGSTFGCLGAATANIMHVLRDYMTLLDHYPQVRYIAGQKIACTEHSVFPYLVRGYFCAFLEGQNVPSEGVGGTLLLAKMQQLIEHGCQGCGSVPLEDGNDPTVMGKLTVNYVRNSECVGLCFYGKSGFVQMISFDDGDNNDDDTSGRRLQQQNTETGTPTTSGTLKHITISTVRYIPAVTHTSSAAEGLQQREARAANPIFPFNVPALFAPPAAPEAPIVTTPPAAPAPPVVTPAPAPDAGNTSIRSAQYIAPVTYVPGDPGYDSLHGAGSGVTTHQECRIEGETQVCEFVE
ncbi:hypothetical protein ACLMJK_004299 [Lecanora helva]